MRVATVREPVGRYLWRCALCPAGGIVPSGTAVLAVVGDHYGRCHREDQ